MELSNEKTSSNRDQIGEAFKWNLKDLYPSDEEWRKDKDLLSARLSSLANFSGIMASSASNLQGALDSAFQLKQEVEKLSVYATMYSDQDTRLSKPMSMKQEIAQVETKLSGIASFIEPEILKISKETLERYLLEHPALGIYRQYLDDTRRRVGHTLSDREEKIIAEAGLMADTPQEVNSILTNADLPYRTVTLSDGKEVTVNPTSYVFHRASSDRSDRIRVFEAFFGALKSFERTLGTQLYGQLKRDLFYRNVRNYGSCLESALHRNNIPIEVYHHLIRSMNANLPVLHRYLRLRKRMLGLDELHYYDSYPSLVREIDLQYAYAEAKSIIQQSLGRLGETYDQILENAFSQRWIDVYPNPGKRSGAYETSAYGFHPYLLINFKGKYEDVSTLAHELGHSAHSHLSNINQPYANSQAPIFLAEVASTVNEALLIDHELNRIANRRQKLSLLGNYLEVFRTTLFRQTQFAEFELLIHEEVEKGAAPTGERFTELYLDILRKYYGHSQGVCTIEDLYGLEWAYIPHFYYNFYVFQYSTSFTAAQAIVSRILAGDQDAVERYLSFLKSGRSDYAIPTLAKVGVDMSSDAPFTLTIKKMNNIMDEIEEINPE